MAKNEDDVRARLRDAALKLFARHGYDRTTAAEIATLAGVTERTFFRHFPDKREVLFDGEAMVQAVLTGAVAAAPADLGPLATLFRAFRSFQPTIEARRPYAKLRHEVIAVTPALHERELAKTDALAEGLAAALRARGVADLPAALAARIGMAAFVKATVAWLDDPETDLGERIDCAHREVKALLVEGT